jgi:hypothetical protein
MEESHDVPRGQMRVWAHSQPPMPSPFWPAGQQDPSELQAEPSPHAPQVMVPPQPSAMV